MKPSSYVFSSSAQLVLCRRLGFRPISAVSESAKKAVRQGTILNPGPVRLGAVRQFAPTGLEVILCLAMIVQCGNSTGILSRHEDERKKH